MTEAKRWAFVCQHCKQASQGVACGKAVWDGLGGHGDGAGPPTEWTLVQCERCRMPTLQMREDSGDGFPGDLRPKTLFPAPRQLSAVVPAELRREWNEAVVCFEAEAYPGCAVMVRRTLEGAAARLGVKDGSLLTRLEKLAKAKLIDEVFAQCAQTIRVLGNRGAHFGGRVSREDADDAVVFAEALLDHIYVIRPRFEAFRARLPR